MQIKKWINLNMSLNGHTKISRGYKSNIQNAKLPLIVQKLLCRVLEAKS